MADLFFIAPRTSPTDQHAAGYDGNFYTTAADARRDIPSLARALETKTSEWLVSSRTVLASDARHLSMVR